MAKMKVHELSKELDVPSKDILTFLQEKGIEAKAAQSSIEDDAIEMVRSKYAKKENAKAESLDKTVKEEGKAKAEPAKKAEDKPAKTEEAKPAKEEAQKPSTDATKTQDKAAHQANGEQPKKKKIIFVSNPHNSNMPGGRPQGNGQRPQGNNGQRPTNGQNQRPQGNGQRPQGNNGQQRHTISGNDYSRQIIKPREQNVYKPIPDKFEAEEPVVQKTETPAANVNTAVNDTNATSNVSENAAKNVAEVTKVTPAAETAENVATKSNDAATKAPEKEQKKEYLPKQNFAAKDKVVLEEAPKREYLRQDFRNGQNNGNNRNNRPNDNRNDRPQRRDGQSNERRPFNGNGDRQPFNKDNNRSQDRPVRRDNNQGSFERSGMGSRPEKPSFASNGMAKPGSDRRDDKFKNKNYDNTKDGDRRQNEKRKNQMEKQRGGSRQITIDDEETLEMKRRTGKFIKPEKKVEVVEETIKVITVGESITIKDLADKMKIAPAAIVKKLFLQGQIVTVNQEISFEEAENIAIEYEIICEHEVKVDVIEELLREEEESSENMTDRPPVICVMGHVDHGKTSLLDAIRKTNVIEREAGGITQAIGAYTVNVNGRTITFLDTPGHEAFTAMRMRGANSTDIAVLVVAADDGVKPQTIEAINHAKAAGVEIIVAVNKIDKPAADPARVRQELTEYELVPTEWGGSTEFVDISAKKGMGIDDLLETILLTADIMELKADPKRKARGLVIEAELDKGRGPVATVLVQKGTLKVGDFVSAGACSGKVRAMLDDKGKQVKSAGPSTPVEILGLNDVPNAGDVLIAHDSDKIAKSFAETFIAQNKEKKLDEIKSRMSLDELFSKIQEGNLKELNLIVKADVQGSVEAVKEALMKLSNEEVMVKCIHSGVGNVNESDVALAGASNAIIIGFNVRPDPVAKTTAEQEGVDIRLYSVIYQAIDDVEAAMKGMLDPVYEEKVIGHAEIRQIFKSSQVGNIAGANVLDGVFQRGCKVRITREEKLVFEGNLASLKRFKDDVKEVKAGFDCGLVFEEFSAMQELDMVEAYIMVEVPR